MEEETAGATGAIVSRIGMLNEHGVSRDISTMDGLQRH